MAKVEGPLFSVTAAGKFNESICFRRKRHGATVYMPCTPAQPHTANQMSQRASFTSAISSWKNLASASKAWWNEKARGTAACGYTLYVKNYLLGLV